MTVINWNVSLKAGMKTRMISTDRLTQIVACIFQSWPAMINKVDLKNRFRWDVKVESGDWLLIVHLGHTVM